ncbi:MAG: hemolysin family protein [Desulfovibrionaceae bacterium]
MTPLFDLILWAGLAISISALCSVAEATLYSVPWSAIENLRKQGRRSGHILYDLRTDIEKPISAILTLNTIANTAGASLAGASAAKAFGSDVLGMFAALFTLSILVFSEILPKTLGVAYCRQIAPALARPMRALVWLLMPLIWITGSMARLLRPRTARPVSTEEDIRAIVSLTRRSGLIKPYEEVAIRNILSLDCRTVHDIMTPRTVVFSLSADLSMSDARSMRDFWHYSRIPVYDNNDQEDIVGLVYRRSIMEALANDQFTLRVVDIMRPVKFVLETLSLDRLLAELLDSRTHLCVVLDEYGGLAGVVTLEDVLEEILGQEIMDETDTVQDLRELARSQRKQLTKSK